MIDKSKIEKDSVLNFKDLPLNAIKWTVNEKDDSSFVKKRYAKNVNGQVSNVVFFGKSIL